MNWGRDWPKNSPGPRIRNRQRARMPIARPPAVAESGHDR